MEFNVEKEGFMSVLQGIQGIAEKRNTMPILSNVFIETTASGVNIMATDLEVFIKDVCAAKVRKKGATTVNARKFFEIIKTLPEETADILSTEGEKVTIKSGKTTFNIMGLPAKEFPSFPAAEEGALKKIDPALLREMIDKTSFAVSTDETRYNINGFYFEKVNKNIRMVTTDGHRLAMMEKEAQDMPAEGAGVIMPRKGIMEIKRLLDEGGEDYRMAVTKKSATLKKDAAVINIRLIEGEFPDYKQVIPKDNDKKAVAKRDELLDALKRMSILSLEKIKGVKFSLSRNNLKLSTSSPEGENATDEVTIEYKGPDLEAAFNARYFIDALEVLTDEKISIELKDPTSPALLKPNGSTDYNYVVMPMRL